MRRLYSPLPLVVIAAFALPGPALAAPAGLDAGFGTDGVTKIDFFSGQADQANGMAIAPGGKIVVVGEAQPGGATTEDFAVARLNPDGSLDETFGSGGKRTIDFEPLGSESWDDEAEDVVVQPDGKIVVAGTSYEPGTDNGQMTITRLRAEDGATDLTFGDPSTPGVIHIGLGGNGTVANAIDRFSNGKLVVAGIFYGTTSTDMAWAGLNQVGQEDPISGSVSFTPGSTDYAFDVAVTPDGNFVAAGDTNGGSDAPYDIGVVRRKGTDGSQDNTFSDDGRASIGYGGNESALAVAVQPDNRVVTAGSTNASPGGTSDDFLVHRFTAAGLPDTSFGAPVKNGAAFVDFGSGTDGASDLKLLSGGKIAVVGTTEAGFGPARRIDVSAARLAENGDLDSSFGVGGKRTIELPDTQRARALAVQPDGGFLVAGDNFKSGTGDFFVMRIGKFTPRRVTPKPPQPPPPPPPPPPVRPGLASVAISARSLKASAKGVVGIRLKCSAAAACRGTVDLTTARKVSVAAKKRKLRLARRSFSIRAGKTQTVKLKLQRRGLRLLRKRRKLRVRLTITTRRTGAKATKVRRPVTLSAARKRNPRR